MQIKIRQQPLQGRISGFSNLEDRRMLDPPLVVELVFDSCAKIESTIDNSSEKLLNESAFHNMITQEDSNTGSDAIIDESVPEEYICNIILHSDGPDLASIIAKPKAYQHSPYSIGKRTNERHYAQRYSNMIGKTTCCGQILYDQMAQAGIFFVFPDLSIRIAGWYSIEATVMHIPTYYLINQNENHRSSDHFSLVRSVSVETVSWHATYFQPHLSDHTIKQSSSKARSPY
jgi:hypothetical protein